MSLLRPAYVNNSLPATTSPDVFIATAAAAAASSNSRPIGLGYALCTPLKPDITVDIGVSLASTTAYLPTPNAEAGPSRGRTLRSPPVLTRAASCDGRRRYLFIAVRRGRTPGVYTDWIEAERQVEDHPDPVCKTFSTKLAAEAFVAGWDGGGRHSLPASSPQPLREHLAMLFPASVSIPSSANSRRPSYHSRLSSSLMLQPDHLGADFDPSPPILRHSAASWRSSEVRISSPLRLQVDEESRPAMRKSQTTMGIGGLLSPPTTPHDLKQGLLDRARPTRPREAGGSGLWSSEQHRQFPVNSKGLGLLSPPNSPPMSPVSGQRAGPNTKSSSGLWSDGKSSPRSPLGSPMSERSQPDFKDSTAPAFSRADLRRSGVVMPVAAPKHKTSRPSLRSRDSSSSLSSTSSSHTLRRHNPSTASQDRLASLAETSKRELLLNEEGLLALGSLEPPRAAFMRRAPSSSSLASTSSVSSMTSTSSLSVELGEDPEEAEESPVLGTELQISCTKSDGDADGSVESSSMKSGSTGSAEMGKAKKKGGLFKRLGKAIGLEKKAGPGTDSGRRGSL